MAGISGATEGEQKTERTHERKRPKDTNSEQLINGHGKKLTQSRPPLGSDDQGQTTCLFISRLRKHILHYGTFIGAFFVLLEVVFDIR